ncbi:MAG: hypothetical protein IJZ72_07875 [Oscillospiraceae bacterium]|nr:hypothetical protein [Oscillospiraceae bacterium]
MSVFKLEITAPSGELPLIEHRRHFNVWGKITGSEPVPENAVFTVRLLDEKGNVLRHAYCMQKNGWGMYLYHPMLTCYKEELDPNRKKMSEFGFPELAVRDGNEPLKSLKEAAIKCWYNDTDFKAVIVSGTDTAHGMVFNDGIGFTDENGEPYEVLPDGFYIVTAELSSAEGKRLAYAEKRIEIGYCKNQVICRFNPAEHRVKMTEWCRQMDISISNDTIPGYLDSYLGKWYYHMGLLPMYRANDIAAYTDPVIHMFVYLTAPDSTSYETELAFLQEQGAVGDKDRFKAYHYDIGEAVIGKGRDYEQQGEIVEFGSSFLDVCRVDIVSVNARENVYDLSERDVVRSITDLENITVHAGERIAVMGVVKPWQLDRKDFRRTAENIYSIGNSVNSISYLFDDGVQQKKCTRKLMMERICGEPIGSSVYEFYNIFDIPEDISGRTLKIKLTACDKDGENPEAVVGLEVRVK